MDSLSIFLEKKKCHSLGTVALLFFIIRCVSQFYMYNHSKLIYPFSCNLPALILPVFCSALFLCYILLHYYNSVLPVLRFCALLTLR